MFGHLLQANAEPDLQQTGIRLKPVIAGLVEGCLQLVADDMPALSVSLGHAQSVCKGAVSCPTHKFAC